MVTDPPMRSGKASTSLLGSFAVHAAFGACLAAGIPALPEASQAVRRSSALWVATQPQPGMRPARAFGSTAKAPAGISAPGAGTDAPAPAADPAEWNAYASAVRARIEKVARADARRREALASRRTVLVAFSLNPRGELERFAVKESSGAPAVDQAALETVAKASPFPPFPESLRSLPRMSFRLPVQYLSKLDNYY